MTEAAAAGDTWRSRFAVGMLVLALVPIVVSVGRAIASGWVPTFDAGYFTVRSRDVLTADHPWVGAWSSASDTLGATVNNLGPLQLDLLAPFTKVNPYGGTAVGVGVIAVASVVAVWWSAHRVLGPLAAGAAMAATVALEAAVGAQAFVDPRQQLYLLMPYWALLWLTWAVATGYGPAIAPLVFTASLIAQTHFTYVWQVALLVTAGICTYVLTVRRRWLDVHATRWLLVGLAVGLVSWAQPLWDQIAGDRNLGSVLANRGTNEGVGWTDGARLVAATVLRPPTFWLPGTMSEFALPLDLPSSKTAWVVLGLWLVALVAATVVALRRGDRRLALLAGIAVVGLGAAVVAGAQIPLTPFSYSPQNYFWMWPTGAFLTVALAGIVLTTPMLRRRVISRPGALGFAGGAAVLAMVGCSPVDNLSAAPNAQTAGARVARPVLDQFAAAIRRDGLTGPVLIDSTRASFGNYVDYTLLAELQDAGVEFRYPAGDRSVSRFGRRRCDDGVVSARIVIADAGGDPRPREDESILVHVDAFQSADEASLASLDRQFGDWLRDGTVGLDLPALEFLAGRELSELREVLRSPGRSATGLATVLGPWPDWGFVDVPASLQPDFDRWTDLQMRSTADDITILLAPMPDDGRDGAPVHASACLR